MPIDHKKETSYLSQWKYYEAGGVGRKYWDYRDDKVFSFIKDEHKKIIDLGCGEGITLKKLTDRFPERDITGIDVVEENISICKEHGLSAQLGSAYDLSDIDKGSVDLCVFSEVIEHLDDPALALKSINGVLKEGGELIIVFPNDFMFKLSRITFLMFKEAFADFGHVEQFTPKKIKRLLKDSGFEVQTTLNTPFRLWPISLHCIVSAKKVT